MNRDELARHLYVNEPGDPHVAGVACTRCATEWDEGLVTDNDVKDCYAQADRMIAEGATR